MGCATPWSVPWSRNPCGTGGTASHALSPANRAVATSEHSGLAGSTTLSGSQSEAFEKQ